MLGCSWAFNTQFHRYEESAAVPYRYSKVFRGTRDLGDGPLATEAAMWVRDLEANPINDFSPAVRRLREGGHIRSAPLWRGTVESAGVGDIARICRADLAADPYAYVANAAQAAHALARKVEAKAQPPLRLAVLGSSNLHFLESLWPSRLGELLPERRVELHAVPYGQMRQALVDPASELSAFAPAVRVFCDRLQDVAGENAADPEAAAERVLDYARLIAAHHRAAGGWSIVHRFAVLAPSGDSEAARAGAAQVERMNAAMETVLGAVPQIAWVDLSAEAASCPGAVEDPRLWQIGRFAFTEGFSRRLVERWSALTLAMVGKAARLVAVDLDNTLWGGVLGEDGLAGIRIGGDYPGNAYTAFQAALKSLAKRGVALAVSSKNDEDLALRAMDGLPSMLIRSADLSARRINWKPKWQNLRDMAAELNLGLDFVLFIDDNPAEREEVRRHLPGVKVMDLPDDPSLYAAALANSPYLGSVAITAEDRRRVEEYRKSRVRETERIGAASLDDYYASLGMTLHLAPLGVGNAQRAAQLSQKTNQFNTTTRRYDVRDLEKLAQGGADVVVVGIEDRHSAHENIGLLVLSPEGPAGGTVDLYLLSCRVLGRGLESAVARWAVGRAARRGWTLLTGTIVETERNTPVRTVFADSGFAQSGPGTWTMPTDHPPGLPNWLKVVDNVNHQ